MENDKSVKSFELEETLNNEQFHFLCKSKKKDFLFLELTNSSTGEEWQYILR
jgi:hypothetical protein